MFYLKYDKRSWIEYTMGVCSHFKLEHEEQRGKKMLKKKKKKLGFVCGFIWQGMGWFWKKKKKKWKKYRTSRGESVLGFNFLRNT